MKEAGVKYTQLTWFDGLFTQHIYLFIGFGTVLYAWSGLMTCIQVTKGCECLIDPYCSEKKQGGEGYQTRS